MENINRLVLKSLKKTLRANKERANLFDTQVYNNSQGLFQKEASNKPTSEGVDYQDAINAQEEKLKLIERNSNKNLSSLREENDRQVKGLTDDNKALYQQNQNMYGSLKDAIGRVANAHQQLASNLSQQQEEKEKAAQTTTNEEDEEDIEEGSEYIEPTPQQATVSSDSQPTQPIQPTQPTSPMVKEQVKKVLANIGDKYTIGNFSGKITGTFGKRSGDNNVPGRTNEHSRGIDIVTDGNVPIAIADGKIVSITTQGTNKRIHPTKGRAGGNLMTVEITDPATGEIKHMIYAHLGNKMLRDKEKLLGSTVVAGQPLFEGTPGEYNDWTGSGTGAHVKVLVSSVDKHGNTVRDYTEDKNDPTQYLSKYLIQNTAANNQAQQI